MAEHEFSHLHNNGTLLNQYSTATMDTDVGILRSNRDTHARTRARAHTHTHTHTHTSEKWVAKVAKAANIDLS